MDKYSRLLLQKLSCPEKKISTNTSTALGGYSSDLQRGQGARKLHAKTSTWEASKHLIYSHRAGVNSDSSLDYNPNSLLERTELQDDVQWWWWKEWISKLMGGLKQQFKVKQNSHVKARNKARNRSILSFPRRKKTSNYKQPPLYIWKIKSRSA